MHTLDIVYSVALRDYPEDLHAADRMRIETQYAQELERTYGTADNVAAALDSMQALEAMPPGPLSPGDLALVQHWGKANAQARQVALQEFGDVATCRFEVERIPF
ncbi:hypothetical protein [Acidovorax sp. Q11]